VATKPSLISDRLDQSPKNQQLPSKEMRYAAQVVLRVPLDDIVVKDNAERLNGKRFAAGDATADNRRSAIVSGLSPDCPNCPIRPTISGFILSLMECISEHNRLR
jgi:hypothetical protein